MPIPPVFTKLNLKDQSEIFVLNAPKSFEAEIAKLRDVNVRRSVTARSRVPFSLAFVMRDAEVDAFARTIAKAADGDAVVWMAYPKGSSKRYKSEISPTRWQALGEAGFEGVRMIAIDEDWTAVRFRRVEFIKTMRRDPSGAMSKQGRARTAGNARPAGPEKKRPT
jgi:hypothetical protein